MPTNTNSESDAELARISQENSELKTRLAQLEAAIKQRDQSSTSKSATPGPSSTASVSVPKFDSPEAVVRAYLGAATWQDRLPFVARPDEVRPAMQRAYEQVWIAGTVITQLKPEVYSKGKLLPPQKQPDGRILVTVDMTGLDDIGRWEYLVVSTPDGYKVDWLASQELSKKQRREKLIEEWRLKDARLEAQVLQVQQILDYAKMSIKVTNKSDAFISYWIISASVYDRNKQFLANAKTTGSNLRPGESSIKEFIFGNVEATAISSWKLRMEDITLQNETGENLWDAGNYFHFSEVKGR